MKQVPLSTENRADDPVADESRHDGTHEVAPDLAYQRLVLVNTVYYGAFRAEPWVLIDAGIPGMVGRIKGAAEARFGEGARPAAIILTHGHFDHVGSLLHLAEAWDVPLYAHPLEHPYLTGSKSYPPPDPGVGGGLMARMASLYPNDPIDVSRWLQPLPADGSVPFMAGWQWLPTPGHTPGQVALWRASDRSLIAADAFITTDQESAYAVALQKPEMHGPPMYFTPDWPHARESVRTLAALEPELVITGHGPAMHGAALRAALHTLARDFDQIAVPEHGRYVGHPVEG